MQPISEQYLNSPCEVKAMDNRLILIGSLSKITDEEIEITEKGDKLPLIHCNSTVKVSVYNDSLGFKVLVGKVFLSNDDFVRIVELQSIADFEKRNFFRVSVDVEGQACAEQSGEGGNNTRKPVPFRIRILNISLSGLFFVCDKLMDIGKCVTVTLNLYGTKVPVKCKILRKVPVNMNTEDGYGCEFTDSGSGRPYDLLCKYLFDCQRRQIQRTKDTRL